eukprot:COSAG05_NODE_778_length_7403_cov_636.272180_10_plen_160_part_00
MGDDGEDVVAKPKVEFDVEIRHADMTNDMQVGVNSVFPNGAMLLVGLLWHGKRATACPPPPAVAVAEGGAVWLGTRPRRVVRGCAMLRGVEEDGGEVTSTPGAEGSCYRGPASALSSMPGCHAAHVPALDRSGRENGRVRGGGGWGRGHTHTAAHQPAT